MGDRATGPKEAVGHGPGVPGGPGPLSGGPWLRVGWGQRCTPAVHGPQSWSGSSLWTDDRPAPAVRPRVRSWGACGEAGLGLGSGSGLRVWAQGPGSGSGLRVWYLYGNFLANFSSVLVLLFLPWWDPLGAFTSIAERG